MSTALAILAFLAVLASGVVWFRRALAVRIPADRRGFVAVWIAGAGLAVAAFVTGVGLLGGVLAGLALLVAAFFLLTVVISPQKVGDDAIAVGDPLPDVAAPDEHGAAFALSSLRGSPILLKFFRGHW